MTHGMEKHEIAKARNAFYNQKACAKTRGIEWRLTFDEWLAIWVASGKWEQRGRTRGGYVMCRHGDVGPYAVGNVRIGSQSENAKEAVPKRSPRGGVYCLYPGAPKPWVAKYRRRELGHFATEAEARMARATAIAADCVPRKRRMPPLSPLHRERLSAATKAYHERRRAQTL